jgi:predicted transcriptional regulator
MTQSTTLTELTAEILASYVTRNPVRPSELPDVIRGVHQALARADQPDQPATPATTKASPAQIRKSITPERLISFEDGRGYMVLRRHLTTRGLSPESYRQKWGLPADYPMTAPNYSQSRSELAKSRGLGRKAQAGAN